MASLDELKPITIGIYLDGITITFIDITHKTKGFNKRFGFPRCMHKDVIKLVEEMQKKHGKAFIIINKYNNLKIEDSSNQMLDAMFYRTSFPAY